MKFVGTFAFSYNDQFVALVKKDTKKLPHLSGKWNGIGGKIEIGESPVGAAMREFAEETLIRLNKDDMVFVEYQRFPSGVRVAADSRYCVGDEVYWYAVRLPVDAAGCLPLLPRQNDAGEDQRWHSVQSTHGVYLNEWLCPNVGYLIPKAVIMLQTPYLDRPA
jgi:8-oxo-dGTP pyrophosphatase MutT (NUDIX family)